MTKKGVPLPQTPVEGSHWQVNTENIREYEIAYPELSHLVFVKVIEVRAGYARMGYKETFVTYMDAVEYAKSNKKAAVYNMPHSGFLAVFKEAPENYEDTDLPLAVLASYDFL